MVISNHNVWVVFDKIASVHFILKIYLYFSTGNGQPRETALWQLYRHTFVPYCYQKWSGRKYVILNWCVTPIPAQQAVQKFYCTLPLFDSIKGIAVHKAVIPLGSALPLQRCCKSCIGKYIIFHLFLWITSSQRVWCAMLPVPISALPVQTVHETCPKHSPW